MKINLLLNSSVIFTKCPIAEGFLNNENMVVLSKFVVPPNPEEEESSDEKSVTGLLL